MQRVIRENTYNIVPLPGVVWAAVRRELGEPWDTVPVFFRDIRMEMEDWVKKRYVKS